MRIRYVLYVTKVTSALWVLCCHMMLQTGAAMFEADPVCLLQVISGFRVTPLGGHSRNNWYSAILYLIILSKSILGRFKKCLLISFSKFCCLQNEIFQWIFYRTFFGPMKTSFAGFLFCRTIIVSVPHLSRSQFFSGFFFSNVFFQGIVNRTLFLNDRNWYKEINSFYFLKLWLKTFKQFENSTCIF